jgi:predicted RNA polymerase sigma factor
MLERLFPSPMVTLNHAVRAHLLEMAGDHADAVAAYHRAAERTTSLPERHYLEVRAGRVVE